MSALRAILAIIVNVVVVFSTMLQYHHHDHDGNTFINLSTCLELKLGHDFDIQECHHDGCHDEGCADRHDADDDCSCGLHLTDFELANNLSTLPDIVPISILSAEIVVPEITTSDITKNYLRSDVEVYSPPLVGPLSFRAPPAA